jgi:hypothetical protein
MKVTPSPIGPVGVIRIIYIATSGILIEDQKKGRTSAGFVKEGP